MMQSVSLKPFDEIYKKKIPFLSTKKEKMNPSTYETKMLKALLAFFRKLYNYFF